MTQCPACLGYTATHMWVTSDDEYASVGLTDHGQFELGPVIGVELPAQGAALTRGGLFGAIESENTVVELLSPLTGNVVDVNNDLLTAASAVNTDPYGAGWIVRVHMADRSELGALMSPEEYESHTSGM